jgi:hypothetical protein
MIKKHIKKLLRRVSPAFDRRVRRFEEIHAKYVEKKLRFRTDEELKRQGQGLKEIRDTLNDLGVPYYVTHGTLLGTIRDGDFIKWDWDVGVSLKTEDVSPKFDRLISQLRKNGFEIRSCNSRKTTLKIDALKYGARYELVGFFKLGNMRYRRGFQYPGELFGEGTEITLRGETYRTVNKPEMYLEWMYGDWKTPIVTCDKKVYISPKARPPFVIRRLLKLF